MTRTADDQPDDQARPEYDDRIAGDHEEPRRPDASSSKTGGLTGTEPAFDPASHPASQFRDDLHRALEQTHRQQAARRVLGAHYSDYQRRLDEQRRQRWLLALLTALVALLVVAMIQRRKGQ